MYTFLKILQSLGQQPRACKLAGMVELTGEYNFYIKGEKLNSSLSNQVNNSPLWLNVQKEKKDKI